MGRPKLHLDGPISKPLYYTVMGMHKTFIIIIIVLWLSGIAISCYSELESSTHAFGVLKNLSQATQYRSSIFSSSSPDNPNRWGRGEHSSTREQNTTHFHRQCLLYQTPNLNAALTSQSPVMVRTRVTCTMVYCNTKHGVEIH